MLRFKLFIPNKYTVYIGLFTTLIVLHEFIYLLYYV